MKKLLSLMPAILLVAAGCNSSDTTQKNQTLPQNQIQQTNNTGWNIFTNTKYGYTISYPKDLEGPKSQ